MRGQHNRRARKLLAVVLIGCMVLLNSPFLGFANEIPMEGHALTQNAGQEEAIQQSNVVTVGSVSGLEVGLASISGQVWSDANESGTKDAGESGISGARVLLFESSDKTQSIDEVATDSGGYYRFDGLVTGSYYVAVEAQAINGKEYLIPIAAMQPGADNKFDADWSNDPARSFSGIIQIADGEVVVGIDAAMRSDVQITPLSDGDYRVSKDNGPFVSYTTLKDAVATGCADSNASYVIEAWADDLDMGTMAEIGGNNKDITLTSGGGGTRTITQIGDSRHIRVWNNPTNTLILENIILAGKKRTTGTAVNGGVRVGYNASLIMNSGASITDCYGGNDGDVTGGGGIYIEDGKLTLNGGKITGNTTSGNGGGVRAGAAIITINSGSIEGNTAAGNGGGIYLQATNDHNSVFNLAGGDISKNKAGNGGGIFAKDGDGAGANTVTLAAGSITKNHADGDGGGIRVEGVEKVSITGSDINENSAMYGAGVSANSGIDDSITTDIEMSGGSIKGNIAGSRGGGVNIDKSRTTFTLSGTGSVEGNKAQTGGGLIASGSAKVVMSGGSFIKNESSDFGGGGMMIEANSPLSITGGTITGNIASGGNGGGLCLLGNNSATISKVTITGNKATAAGTSPGNGGGIFIENNNGLTIAESIITENEALYGDAGGIRGTNINVTITECNISQNSGKNGAGVSLNGGSVIVMTDTTVNDNIGTGRGGGVNLDNGTTLTMVGGSITGNMAVTGGGVIANSSNFNLQSGTVGQNEATNNGGGFSMEATSILSVSGGSIIGNETSSNGGGVYLQSGATLNATAGSITGNFASSGDGGGIYTENHSYLDPLDASTYYTNLDIGLLGVTISGNTSKSLQVKPANVTGTPNFDVELLTNHQINYYRNFILTYDPNGGSGTEKKEKHAAGALVTVKSALDVIFLAPQTEYELKYWSDDPGGIDAGGNRYDPGDTFAIEKETTLYAIWGPQGTVSGNVFEDNVNRNDLYDLGEGLVSRDVVLCKKDSVTGEYTVEVATTTTDDDGYYEFEVEKDQSYKVFFKLFYDDKVGEWGFVKKGTAEKSSHANDNGFSDEIVVSDASGGKTEHTVNAGYIPYMIISGIDNHIVPWVVAILLSGMLVVGLFIGKRRPE